jgi:hypothetical protein
MIYSGTARIASTRRGGVDCQCGDIHVEDAVTVPQSCRSSPPRHRAMTTVIAPDERRTQRHSHGGTRRNLSQSSAWSRGRTSSQSTAASVGRTLPKSLALAVTWWDLPRTARCRSRWAGRQRVRAAPSRSGSVGERGPIGPGPQVATLCPNVAADRAAPQAEWQDRRPHVQIHGQCGLTHGTDRHQRPPLVTAARGGRCGTETQRNQNAPAVLAVLA